MSERDHEEQPEAPDLGEMVQDDVSHTLTGPPGQADPLDERPLDAAEVAANLDRGDRAERDAQTPGGTEVDDLAAAVRAARRGERGGDEQTVTPADRIDAVRDVGGAAAAASGREDAGPAGRLPRDD